MATLDELTQAIVKGNQTEAVKIVQDLLKTGMAPLRIVEEGLVPGMSMIGEKFRRNEVLVPDMLIAARAMKEAMNILEPLLVTAGIKPKYTAVIGSVAGDLHDIGKNLVALMWRGAHFNVIDLGVDVPVEQFVDAVRQHKPQLVGLSAFNATAMSAMKTIVQALRQSDVPGLKIVVGGSSVTDQYAKEIGADGYAPDAPSAVDLARKLLAT